MEEIQDFGRLRQQLIFSLFFLKSLCNFLTVFSNARAGSVEFIKTHGQCLAC